MCPDRPVGSSCCTLFCARLAIKVLLGSGGAAALDLPNVQVLLAKCVKEWDKDCRGKDGEAPATTLQRICARGDVEVCLKVNDVGCSKDSLTEMLAVQGCPVGVLLTGIPNGGVRQKQLGNTFLLLKLAEQTVVVDSHRHAAAGENSGTVICKSAQSAQAVEWVFGTLLREMDCSTMFVTATAFALKRLDYADLPLSQWAHRLTDKTYAFQAGAASHANGSVSRGVAASQAAAPPPPRAQRVVCANVPSPTGWAHTHETFVPRCARCQWVKHHKAWQAACAFADPITRQLTCSIVEKPRHLGGDWGIGCVLALVSRSLCVQSHLWPSVCLSLWRILADISPCGSLQSVACLHLSCRFVCSPSKAREPRLFATCWSQIASSRAGASLLSRSTAWPRCSCLRSAGIVKADNTSKL